jgi:hypothetical protein
LRNSCTHGSSTNDGNFSNLHASSQVDELHDASSTAAFWL